MIIGIDTGGTNVDAVLVDEHGIANAAKVPNTARRESIEAVLEELLAGRGATQIDRVVVATTLVVNAAVQDRLPDCSNVLVPGPGLSPERAFYGEENLVTAGGIDPRGRVTEPVSLADSVAYPVVAVTAKFSARNPDLERTLRDSIDADHVALGSESGAGLTFPERAATTVANAKAKPVFDEFLRDIEAAVERAAIDAPVYYLKGDGAMLAADSMAETPAHTLRGGSAASSLGLCALSGASDAVTVDIGGTTTDVTRVVDGFPAIEGGIPEGKIEPGYDGVVAESLPVGGDTRVIPGDDGPALADERVGDAVAFGGDEPTVTDALHVLGRFTAGDRSAARDAIDTVGDGSASELATTVLDRFLQRVRATVTSISTDRTASLVVGGVLAPYLADPLADGTHFDAVVPDHADVAGAVGCGVARVSVETAVHADSARGVMTVTSIGPETVESLEVGQRFTDTQAKDIAIERARAAAKAAGGDPTAAVDVRSFSRFTVVEDSEVVGQIFDAEAQVTPGIEFSFAEGSS
ncbi:N-methylhydantoinase A/acetone carboxylase, betasubunit [Halanaeroarchaeum sp. HSR-CO]|uniref:hydantoinase/oxoprolinase family protein n=1 Tax=Halanaeroarchaeum sp. HSR-CO TaxID=2866382 RepID=UPI00217E3EC1|nr:hydantoinase/oxoprolinase family protein [Halanaeroarchaeum sp. HSR-CO]UWG47915.1 N-methylhydantoinase A/acetone carboxylase, betasubunit [Halanaeroarchaeum sp. HSR-CO]